MIKMTGPRKEIIIHHSATADGRVMDYKAIRKYHIENRGWGDIGYHVVIEMVDGEPVVILGRSLEYFGAHTTGKNDAIGICVVGNYDLTVPDSRLLDKLEMVISFFKTIYPIEKVSGHFHYSSKTCPGTKFPIERFLMGHEKAVVNEKAYLKDNLIIKEADVNDIYLLHKLNIPYKEPGFDGCNGTYFYYDSTHKQYNLVAVAYDRGKLYGNNVSHRPPRSTMMVYKDGTREVVRLQDFNSFSRKDDVLWAVGGISSIQTVRKMEEASLGGMPEGVRRPRTAIAVKNGVAYLITSTTYNYSMGYFSQKMEKLGFSDMDWIFLDGGGSTGCYYHNDGKPLQKKSYRHVPLSIGVER